MATLATLVANACIVGTRCHYKTRSLCHALRVVWPGPAMCRLLSKTYLSGSKNYHAIQRARRLLTMPHSAPLVDEKRYKLVYFTPVEPSERIKEAIFATGAGTVPGSNYTKVRLFSPDL